MTDNTYQGWANYSTWNVSLYINNEYAIYKMAQAYARQCERLNEQVNYDDLAEVIAMNFGDITADGVSWTHPELDTDELNEMIRELAE